MVLGTLLFMLGVSVHLFMMIRAGLHPEPAGEGFGGVRGSLVAQGEVEAVARGQRREAGRCQGARGDEEAGHVPIFCSLPGGVNRRCGRAAAPHPW